MTQRVARRRPYPEEGKIFELTLGRETRRFKLVSVGRQPNLKAVREVLRKHGEIPYGQWCEAFQDAYPEPDEKTPIGIADPPTRLPYINPDGQFSFYYRVDDDFSCDWRWLVKVNE